MESRWRQAPTTSAIGPKEAHVWFIDLSWESRSVDEVLHTLAPEERDRAKRFRFSIDRRRFVAAHAVLRTILARYLELESDSIRFSYSEFGKPELACNGSVAHLRFNLSHSHELALVAVTLGDAVGVDVEYMGRDLDVIRIARQFFSQGEFATLDGLEREQQSESFFKCWTQKEAYVKARGEGLSHALSQFEVNCAPGTRGGLLSIPPNLDDESHWTVMAIPIDSNYSAALAVRRRDLEVRYWKWEQKRYSS